MYKSNVFNVPTNGYVWFWEVLKKKIMKNNSFMFYFIIKK